MRRLRGARGNREPRNMGGRAVDGSDGALLPFLSSSPSPSLSSHLQHQPEHVCRLERALLLCRCCSRALAGRRWRQGLVLQQPDQPLLDLGLQHGGAVAHHAAGQPAGIREEGRWSGLQRRGYPPSHSAWMRPASSFPHPSSSRPSSPSLPPHLEQAPSCMPLPSMACSSASRERGSGGPTSPGSSSSAQWSKPWQICGEEEEEEQGQGDG